MNFFDEITKVKEDFPQVHNVKNEVKKQQLNFYQIFAIGMFIVCFFLGIVFGNLFATCQTTSYFYMDTCLVREFNVSLMISIWFISLLIALFFFAIGHIIAILSDINKKLDVFHE